MRFCRLMQYFAYSSGIATLLFPLPASSAQQVQQEASAQQQSQPGVNEKIPVIRTTTTLVFLDVTVLDKKEHPVTTGLTRDDFTITEDKEPQRIFSFEEPTAHLGNSEDNKPPKTVLVLDLLNTSFENFADVCEQARKFLLNQPDPLREEAELMVVGEQSLELLQGFTRSKQDLLFALDHLPAVWPHKDGAPWLSDRIRQSYIALQQIAVQNRGMPDRKNVLWIGRGSPNLFARDIPDPVYDKVQQYIHRTVNMMVEARITLFLIYPGMRIGTKTQFKHAIDSTSEEGSSDPFTDSNFTKFVYETGGKVFGLNDVSREIYDSVQLGSNYYTLTYQPREDKANGEFRRIMVTLRDPDLHVMTKAGFFAREPKEAAESDDKTVNMLTEAVLATIPMNALHIHLASMVRHPDSRTVELTVQVDDSKLGWESTVNGLSQTTVILSTVSLSAKQDILASRIAKYALVAKSQDTSRLANAKPEVRITLRLPRSTRNVRVAIASNDGGRIGSLDLSRKQIDAAPEGPTSDPKLLGRPTHMQAN